MFTLHALCWKMKRWTMFCFKKKKKTFTRTSDCVGVFHSSIQTWNYRKTLDNISNSVTGKWTTFLFYLSPLISSHLSKQKLTKSHKVHWWKPLTNLRLISDKIQLLNTIFVHLQYIKDEIWYSLRMVWIQFIRNGIMISFVPKIT